MVDGFDNDDPSRAAWRRPSARTRCGSSRCWPLRLPPSSARVRGHGQHRHRSGTNEWHGGGVLLPARPEPELRGSISRSTTSSGARSTRRRHPSGRPGERPSAARSARTGPSAFLAFEELDTDANNFVTIDPTGRPAPGRKRVPVELGRVPYAVGSESAFAGSTTTSMPRHRLSFRAHFSTRVNENTEPFGGIVAGSHGVAERATDWGSPFANRTCSPRAAQRGAPPGRSSGDAIFTASTPLRRAPATASTRGGRRSRFRPAPWPAGRSTRPRSERTSSGAPAETLTRRAGPPHPQGRARFRLRLARRPRSPRTSAAAMSSPHFPAIPGVPHPLDGARGLRAGTARPLLQGYGDPRPPAGSDGGLRTGPLGGSRRGSTSWAALRYQRYDSGLPPVTVSDFGRRHLLLRGPRLAETWRLASP